MGRIKVSGPAAQLRYGYQVAADLKDWTFDGELLSATVVKADPFRITQSGLRFFILRNGKAESGRPVLRLGIADGRLTACLGLGKAAV